MSVIAVALVLQVPAPLEAYMRQQLAFSERDVRAVSNGMALVKKLKSSNREEIALAGVVRIAAPAGAAAERFFDLTRSAARGRTTQFGQFSDPPRASDLAGFSVPQEDVGLLRSCRTGKCGLKLPAPLIDSVRTLDWRLASAKTNASGIWQRWLLTYVQGYLARGNNALVSYADRGTPLPLHTGFHTIIQPTPYMYAPVPEFHHYLDEFPARRLPGARDAIYWWTETIPGLRPVTSVTHATLYRPPPQSGVAAIVALKQIFASHYFHAALAYATIVEAGPGAGDSVYVIYYQRLLFDTDLGGLIRRTAESKLESEVRSRLTAVQRGS